MGLSVVLLSAGGFMGLVAFAKRKRDEALAAERMEALQAFREDRLKKVKELFVSQQYDLEKLRSALSASSEVATVAECKALPPPKHKARFYGAEVTDSKYAHWIDRVWNKDVIAFPQIIVRVSTPSDVAACFHFASANSLKISVASGCHSSNAFVDGALTIDMALLNKAHYDPETKEASAEAGATLRAVDAACRAHGRVIPVGTNGDTGVAGLTLSGGNGWLSRKFGLTVDNLVGIDIVLPDGKFVANIRDSSPPEQRDLLWACRGSGGHFGVVTKFYYQTHAMPNKDQFLLGQVVPLCPSAARKKAVVKAWWGRIQKASEDTQCILVLPTAPVVPNIWLHYGPEAVQGKDALKTVADLKEASTPVPGGGLVFAENSWEVVDHQKVQTLVADQQAHGYIYQTMVAVVDLSDKVIECMVENIGRAPAGSVLILMPVGDKVTGGDTPQCDRCSLSTRHAKIWILAETRWDPEVDGNAAGKARSSKWCKDFVYEINSTCGDVLAKTAHAFSDVREENAGEGNNVLVDVTKADVAKRLRAIKQRVDPLNLLSHNRKLSSNK